MSARPYRFLYADPAGAGPGLPPPAPTAKMSFYDLQARFWQLEAEQPFSGNETKCYFYWLNRFNAERWPAQLRRFLKQVAADLSLDEKSVAKAAVGLQRRGLLAYTAGTRSQAATWKLPSDERNFSGRQAAEPPRTSRDERNFSAQEGKFGAPTSHDDRKNSAPYKEEEKTVGKEEEKTPPPREAAGAAGGGQKKIGESASPENPDREAAHARGAADVATAVDTGPPPTPRPHAYDPEAVAANLRLPFASAAFRAAWVKWRTYREERRYERLAGGMMEQTALHKLADLAGGEEARALAIIDQAIEKGWKNLYKLDNQYAHASTQGPAKPGAARHHVPQVTSYGSLKRPK